MINIQTSVPKPRHFRFESAWTISTACQQIVQKCWAPNQRLTSATALAKALKNKVWPKNLGLQAIASTLSRDGCKRNQQSHRSKGGGSNSIQHRKNAMSSCLTSPALSYCWKNCLLETKRKDTCCNWRRGKHTIFSRCRIPASSQEYYNFSSNKWIWIPLSYSKSDHPKRPFHSNYRLSPTHLLVLRSHKILHTYITATYHARRHLHTRWN